MKASYVAMTKGSSADLTKEFMKQEVNYPPPTTSAATPTDVSHIRSQRTKK